MDPNLVILDWMLPKMDGLEVLKHLRRTSNVPVLMLTARGDEIDRVVGLEVGADDYLVKPFGMRELIARIHALLRRSNLVQLAIVSDRSGNSVPVQWGPFSISPDLHEVALDGRILELSHTEFDLLYLFLRNPGRVFTRAYLLETIWGTTVVENDRSVDSAVTRLRKKIGAAGERIESVRGVGYRLNRNVSR
jgi:DNA-binding response OmpR family regulator